MTQLQNINIRDVSKLAPPGDIKGELGISDAAAESIADKREQLKRILSGEDKRVFLIVGPCSIHNDKIAIEYAEKLHAVAKEVSDRILVVMRVYFEKPRTTVGWKGLINDPHLDGTFDIDTGMRMARNILVNVATMGLAAATEMLEPITPQYIADLITQASIGARTTESPTHRQMASGLSMPVGYKNSTEGSLEIAINAMQAGQSQHSFLGIDDEGKICVMHTSGNPWGHMILRGGRPGPNYDAASVANAESMLRAAELPPRFVVDCSHANSSKDYTKQPDVFNNVIAQRAAGNESIVGLMLESNLNEGKQKLTENLEYGVSITDGCIGWDQTAELIRSAYKQLG